MKQVLLAAAAIGFAWTAAAHDAAPTLNVTKRVELHAAPAAVWSTIGNFADLTWVSLVKSSTATRGNAVGSVRTLDLGGPQLVERLTKYEPKKMRYAYAILNTPANRKVLPVSHYHSVIAVMPAAGGGSTVTWHGTFERADTSATPAAGQDDAAAVKAVTGVYETGLGDLAKKFGG